MTARGRALIGKIYDHVEFALWVFLSVFVGYFFVFVLPSLPAAVERAEIEWQSELAADASRYCAKWGLSTGTHAHTLCTMDVQEIRSKKEKHLVEASAF
jgi:hypothetical protein